MAGAREELRVNKTKMYLCGRNINFSVGGGIDIYIPTSLSFADIFVGNLVDPD